MKAFIYSIITVLFISLYACEKPYSPEKEKNKKETTIDSEDEKEEEKPSDDEKKIPSEDKKESENNPPTPEKPNPDKEKEGTTPDNPSNDKPDNGNVTPKEDHISISDFLTKDYLYQIWVQGYIVGSCSGNIKNATLEAPFSGQSAILLADNPNEKDIKKMIAIELKSRSQARKELNLVDNPNNFGRKIKIFGYQEDYLNIPGIKSWGNSYEWVK